MAQIQVGKQMRPCGQPTENGASRIGKGAKFEEVV